MLRVFTESKVLQVEGCCVRGNRVRRREDFFDILSQMAQLSVVLVPVEGQDRDAVGELVPEAADAVVHDEHLIQRPVLDDAQVLDGTGQRRRLHVAADVAVVAVEQESDVLHGGVESLDHFFRVVFVRRSEDQDFEVFGKLFQDLSGVRPDVQGCLFEPRVPLERSFQVLKASSGRHRPSPASSARGFRPSRRES